MFYQDFQTPRNELKNPLPRGSGVYKEAHILKMSMTQNLLNVRVHERVHEAHNYMSLGNA